MTCSQLPKHLCLRGVQSALCCVPFCLNKGTHTGASSLRVRCILGNVVSSELRFRREYINEPRNLWGIFAVLTISVTLVMQIVFPAKAMRPPISYVKVSSAACLSCHRFLVSCKSPHKTSALWGNCFISLYLRAPFKIGYWYCT